MAPGKRMTGLRRIKPVMPVSLDSSDRYVPKKDNRQKFLYKRNKPTWQEGKDSLKLLEVHKFDSDDEINGQISGVETVHGNSHTVGPYCGRGESGETALNNYVHEMKAVKKRINLKCGTLACTKKRGLSKGITHLGEGVFHGGSHTTDKTTKDHLVKGVKCKLLKRYGSTLTNKSDKKLNHVFSGTATVKMRNVRDCSIKEEEQNCQSEQFFVKGFVPLEPTVKPITSDNPNGDPLQNHLLPLDATTSVGIAKFPSDMNILSNVGYELSRACLTEQQGEICDAQQNGEDIAENEYSRDYEDKNYKIDEVVSKAASDNLECHESVKLVQDNIENVTDELVITRNLHSSAKSNTVHNTIDNYQCPLCSESYKNPNTLIDHYTFFHSRHSPYVCTFDGCPALLNKQNSKKHLCSHIYKSNFDCPYCTYSHKSLYLLKHHLLIHEEVSTLNIFIFFSYFSFSHSFYCLDNSFFQDGLDNSFFPRCIQR